MWAPVRDRDLRTPAHALPQVRLAWYSAGGDPARRGMTVPQMQQVRALTTVYRATWDAPVLAAEHAGVPQVRRFA